MDLYVIIWELVGRIEKDLYQIRVEQKQRQYKSRLLDQESVIEDSEKVVSNK